MPALADSCWGQRAIVTRQRASQITLNRRCVAGNQQLWIGACDRFELYDESGHREAHELRADEGSAESRLRHVKRFGDPTHHFSRKEFPSQASRLVVRGRCPDQSYHRPTRSPIPSPDAEEASQQSFSDAVQAPRQQLRHDIAWVDR